MAILTSLELQAQRQLAAKFAAVVSWTKGQINAALQAIEDAVQSSSNVGGKTLKVYIASAIETAAPGVFSIQQKDQLFLLWCVLNVRRGGVL